MNHSHPRSHSFYGQGRITVSINYSNVARFKGFPLFECLYIINLMFTKENWTARRQANVFFEV